MTVATRQTVDSTTVRETDGAPVLTAATQDLDAASLFASTIGWAECVPLSPRECEIARQIARDLTNKEIAAVLEISEWTVSTYIRRMFTKLGVHSKAAMVAKILDRVAAARRQRDPRA